MHKKQSRPQTPVIIIIKRCHIPGTENKDSRKELCPDSRYQMSHCVGQFLQMLSSKRQHETLKILFVSLQCQTSGLPCFRVINWAAGWFSPSTLWCVLKPRTGTLGPPAVFYLAHSPGSSRNVSIKLTTTKQQQLVLSRLTEWQMWFKGTL